jgi:hypothetical protein
MFCFALLFFETGSEQQSHIIFILEPFYYLNFHDAELLKNLEQLFHLELKFSFCQIQVKHS